MKIFLQTYSNNHKNMLNQFYLNNMIYIEFENVLLYHVEICIIIVSSHNISIILYFISLFPDLLHNRERKKIHRVSNNFFFAISRTNSNPFKNNWRKWHNYNVQFCVTISVFVCMKTWIMKRWKYIYICDVLYTYMQSCLFVDSRLKSLSHVEIVN